MIHDYGQHFIFPGCNDDATVKNIMAQVADVTDQAIYNAIIKEAQDAGVTDLYLMDKKFVLDALREKLERENPKPLTIEQLKQMNGEPVWLPDGNRWGIIDIDESGVFAGMPFVCFEDRGIPHAWNIERREIRCLRHKPKEEEK